MNRGSVEAARVNGETLEASMRPRFMNRGSVRDHRILERYQLGFNEAPIHESGKYLGRIESGDQNVGFNEAPIHESGKYSVSLRIFASDPGFNEAPIHESGKFCTTCDTPWSQRSFNEAPIHESGK